MEALTAVLDLAGVRLVDQHCHGVAAGELDADAFGGYLTEAVEPVPGAAFDSPLGLAVRAVCPPLLGLPAHAAPGEYLARRVELGAEEVTRRLLGSTGIADYLLDTGLGGAGGPLLGPAQMAAAGRARAHEVVRLEAVAGRVLASGVGAEGFAGAFADALGSAVPYAVGVKSIAAYRYGLDLDPARPSGREVAAAAGVCLAAGGDGAAGDGEVRVADPVLLRHLLWAGIDAGLPVQVHTGFGDPDLTLHRADPAVLTPFLRATQPAGVPVVLLHCYPYHRNAGYLAHAFPHVYADVGLALSHTGARSGAVLAEFLELTPFGKLLFSTDAYGLPELYAVGVAAFRTGLRAVLAGWVEAGACTAADAARVAGLVAAGNARQLYRLP